MKTAIKIETNEWRSIVHHLYQNGWKVVEKYIGHDASIDIDYVVLSKDGTSVELGWEHMDGGEIKCSEETFNFLENLVKHKFEYGKAEVLNFKMKMFIKPLSFSTRLIGDKNKLMEDFFYFNSTNKN